MGVWNFKLYSSDTSCDVRDTYLSYLKQQLDDKEAFQRTYAEYIDLIGTDEEQWFWFALAESQWKYGRLDSEVKEKALYFINVQRVNCDSCENTQFGTKMKNMLDMLERTITSPMRPKKIFGKQEAYIHNPWNVGDMYAYQFHTPNMDKWGLLNKYILLQKIGDVEYYDNRTFSAIRVLNAVFDDVPAIEELPELQVLPLIYPPGVEGTPDTLEEFVPSFRWYLSAIMVLTRKADYPHKFLTFIGNLPVERETYDANSMSTMFWQRNGMDIWLADYYVNWRDVYH